MSEIKVDTLTGKTTANDITVTVGASATMSLEQGLAKAWVYFDGSGTVAINNSLNGSSLTDIGTGNYEPNVTNAFSATTSYCTTLNVNDDNVIVARVYEDGSQESVRSTVKFRMTTGNASTNARRDFNMVDVVIHGDLA